MGEKLKNVKISVIMPVYNAEKYISDTLNSIKNQTLTDYEVILVDDGSKDLSKEICDKYCVMDNRFKVIHQANYGAAISRNNGAKKARGKYIIFLDADDMFKKDFLEKMYTKAEVEDADVCVCGFEEIDADGQFLNINIPDMKKSPDADDYLAVQFLAPWTKLCKRRFLNEMHIIFQNISSSNDVYYSVCALLDADKVALIPEALVRYRVSSTEFQISANRNPKNFGMACELLIKRYTDHYDLRKQTQIIVMMLRGMVSECKSCCDEEKNRVLYNFVKDFITNRKECEIIKDQVTQNAICIIKKNEYSRELILELFSFDKQIALHKEQIVEKLNSYKRIVLWGVGERGKAFIRFCSENKIPIIAVTDKEHCDIGAENIMGHEVITTERAFAVADLIVACNDSVYNEIKDNKEGMKILNLQQFI